MNIAVYTRSNCQPCKATKRALNKSNTAFTEIMITDENRDLLIRLNLLMAPAVIIKNKYGVIVDSWSGFQPEKIQSCVTQMAEVLG